MEGEEVEEIEVTSLQVDVVQRLRGLIDVGLTRDRGVSSSIDRAKSCKQPDVRLMT